MSLTASVIVAEPYKIAVIGLVHSHVWSQMPRMIKNDPVKLVGISEPNADLTAEAKKLGAADNLFFDDYKRMLDESQPLPQLIVIDGGKGQLSAAMNSLRKLKLDGKIAVIGIAMDEDGWDSVKPYIEQHKMNYRIVVGNDQVSQLFGSVDSLPTTLMIDREGRIASMHIGLVAKNTYQKEIEKLLEAPKDGPKTGAVRAPGSEFAVVRPN